MKNIQVLLNLDDLTEMELVDKLKLLVRRAQIFLLIFIIDVVLFIVVTGLEIYKYFTQQDITPEAWSLPQKIFYVTYAMFLLLWFCYYMFLAHYFWNMLKKYSHTILQLDRKQ